MDPNANLAEIRHLVESMREEHEVDALDAARLVELIEALDNWIVGGGFLPEAWQHVPTETFEDSTNAESNKCDNCGQLDARPMHEDGVFITRYFCDNTCKTKYNERRRSQDRR